MALSNSPRIIAKSFPTRKIGDVSVSAIGFGAMGIAGMAYGAAPDDEERFKVFNPPIYPSDTC